jgi:hypothetical protein
MLEIAIYLFGSDIGRHGDNGNGGVALADIQSGGDTIKSRHDNVHKDHVEVIPTDFVDTRVGLGTIWLNSSQY